MSFSVPTFLPYLLNQASEAASREFQTHYRARYSMLRTEWRVLFHLGCYGDLTAKRICDMASLHKTKVSRAVQALEAKRFLTKRTDPADRRVEQLSLTAQGQTAFQNLSDAAAAYEDRLIATLAPEDVAALRRCLTRLADLPDRS